MTHCRCKRDLEAFITTKGQRGCPKKKKIGRDKFRISLSTYKTSSGRDMVAMDVCICADELGEGNNASQIL